MKLTPEVIIHGITAALVVLDAIVAESANISTFASIDPRFAQYWPQILCGILAADRVAKIILQQFQPPPPTPQPPPK